MYEKIQIYPRVPQMGTALPSNPQNGDQFLLVDSMTAPTYSWLLQYVAAKSSNKWVFVGGAPAYSYVATAETCSSTTAVDLATVGPSITIPVAGTYQFTSAAQVGNSTTANALPQMIPKIGSAATNDEDAAMCYLTAAGAEYFTIGRTRQITCAASDVVKLQYKVSTGTVTWYRRVLSIIPIAIGG